MTATIIVTLRTARCEEHPESPLANYRQISPLMRDALRVLCDTDNERSCLCGERIGAEFDDSDIDGVATGRVYWHTVVLIQGHGGRVAAVCEACDPNPALFTDKDLIVLNPAGGMST